MFLTWLTFGGARLRKVIFSLGLGYYTQLRKNRIELTISSNSNNNNKTRQNKNVACLKFGTRLHFQCSSKKSTCFFSSASEVSG